MAASAGRSRRARHTKIDGPPFSLFGRRAVYRWGDSLNWARSRLTPARNSAAEHQLQKTRLSDAGRRCDRAAANPPPATEGPTLAKAPGQNVSDSMQKQTAPPLATHQASSATNVNRTTDAQYRRTVPRGREAYLEYLRSDAWRLVKLRYMRSRLPKSCYVCDAPWRPGFHFHHKTYKTLGNERLTDIAPICPDCHEALHWGQKLRRMQLRRASKRNRVRRIRKPK